MEEDALLRNPLGNAFDCKYTLLFFFSGGPIQLNPRIFNPSTMMGSTSESYSSMMFKPAVGIKPKFSNRHVVQEDLW